MRRILLLSSSTVHGGGYLEWALDPMTTFLGDDRKLLFVPCARPGGADDDEYTEATRRALEPIECSVSGIHEHDDPREAVRSATAVFIGGGNTFLLLRELWAMGIVELLHDRVASGLPYVGSSAGTNVAGMSIGTTNDMPIVFPPTLEALGLVPFNLNPHYLDPDPRSTHQGETRETRIREFHFHNRQPVLALREGAFAVIRGDTATVRGAPGGLLFRPDREPCEIEAGGRLDWLLA